MTSYSERVAILARWAGPRSLLELGPEDLEGFLDKRRVGAATRASYITAMRSLYRWAVDHDLVERDPTMRMARPKVRAGRPRPVADDVLAGALAEANPETRALLLLGALAGLRVSEMAGLSGEDVDLAAGLLEVVDGKGGKARIVPVHPALGDALRALPMPAAGAVFRSRSGARLTGHAVGDRMREVLGKGGTPHQTRHWAGTQWWRESHDIRTVAELLGHANPQTSMVYAKFDVERGAAVANAVKVPGTA